MFQMKSMKKEETMMENKEKKALSQDEMEKAAGGVVVEDEANKYWIVRQDGTVVAPVQSLEDAVEFAKSLSTNTTVISKSKYKDMFGRDFSW